MQKMFLTCHHLQIPSNSLSTFPRVVRRGPGRFARKMASCTEPHSCTCGSLDALHVFRSNICRNVSAKARLGVDCEQNPARCPAERHCYFSGIQHASARTILAFGALHRFFEAGWKVQLWRVPRTFWLRLKFGVSVAVNIYICIHKACQIGFCQMYF